MRHLKKLNMLKIARDSDVKIKYPITRLKKISKIGTSIVYDMSIKGQHDFSANGIMVSNCYKEDNSISVHKKPPCPYEHKCMVDYMSVDKVAAAVAEVIGEFAFAEV